MESPKAGIVLDTQPKCVNRFVRLAIIRVVASRNEVPLKLGNSVDQTESFMCVFPAALYVPGIVERDAEHEVSHREIWIECNGALKQRDSGQKLALAHLGIARGVVLESFQRWSGGLFEWTIQLLDRVERLSQLGAHGCGGGSQRVQHVLFVARLNLFPSQRRATLAGDCLERDDVVLTQALDRAVYRSRNSFSHADVMRDLVCDANSGRQTHRWAVVLELVGVHDFQKGRLLKLDGESLAQRPVKHRVARRVREISEDDSVFVR